MHARSKTVTESGGGRGFRLFFPSIKIFKLMSKCKLTPERKSVLNPCAPVPWRMFEREGHVHCVFLNLIMDEVTRISSMCSVFMIFL